MPYLIDTQAALWSAVGPKRLSAAALGVLRDPESMIFFSVASIWEIAIKVSKGRLRLPNGIQQFIHKLRDKLHLVDLGIGESHLYEVSQLPWHHRDPFDRVIIAQAKTEGLTVITSDRAFTLYDISVVLA